MKNKKHRCGGKFVLMEETDFKKIYKCNKCSRRFIAYKTNKKRKPK